MLLESTERSLTVAVSIEQALAARKAGATVLAGGTWLMRDPRRGRALPSSLVSLHAIPGLREIQIETDRITVGAGVTHAALSKAIAELRGVEALAAAASGSANPAIRRVATVGGNLCSIDFAAADLLPALLALDAQVALQADEGPVSIAMEDFVARRDVLLSNAILSHVIISRKVVASSHARLPLRKAGDYPVVIVSLARTENGELRIAVGSVEEIARRWISLENALAGRVPDVASAVALALEHNDFKGRDGVEAEGWYRRQVLPAIFGRALTKLRQIEATNGGHA